MTPDQKPGANFFTYNYLASSQVDFITIILSLCKFKACKLSTQIRKIMLLHSELLWIFITLSIKYV